MSPTVSLVHLPLCGAFHLPLLILSLPDFKITELFTPYLWDSNAQKTVFYRAQSINLLTLDTIRIFLSFFMLIAVFLSVSGRFAIDLWIHKKPHPLSKNAAATTSIQNKVFVATQNQPLLMDTGEKHKDHPHHHEKKTAPPPTPPTAVQHDATLVPIPNQVPVQAPPPPQYPGIGFAPGMLQLPHNMQTTIVYTPAMAYENVNGQMTVEQFK